MSKKLSVIIPTFNEAENIAPLLSRLSTVLNSKHEYEIIVSDDDSPDGTWQIVKEFSKQNPCVRLIHRKGKKKGLSLSVIDAFSESNGEILLVMDGDGQHDESIIPEMIAVAQDKDMVIGSRFMRNSTIEENWPIYRLGASKTAIFLLSALLGIKLSDPMSGCFAVSKNALSIVSPYLKGEGFKIMLEILYVLMKKSPDSRISEFGIKFKKREKGESKLGIAVGLDFLKMIFRLRMTKF
jgi:dolichol-phosphate mannosyltransferase